VCQREHWRDIFDGHKTTCSRVSKANFLKKPDLEAYMCNEIQDRLWRLEGHTKPPDLLPSGECTITSGHQEGPVKVVVDFIDGTTRTLVITDEPGIRPVSMTLTEEDPRRRKKYQFQTQADMARWSMGNMNLRWFVTALLNKFNEDFIWE